jgi:crossover junction endodeoxyribonuclease RuvC
VKTLGIDPGARGGLALISDGKVVAIADMPAIEIKGRARVDAARLALLITEWKPDAAVIEAANAMPGQGVVSMFQFGKAAGVALGVLAALQIPTTEVSPVRWKRALSVPAEKGAARARASQLFPAAADWWPLVKHDGRAEAALLGLYGERNGGVS